MIAKMILVAIAEPAFVLALVLGIRKNRIGPRVACGMIAAVVLASLFLNFPALAVQGMATLVAFLIFVLFRAKSEYWAAVLFAPVFALYALCAVVLTASEARDLSFAHALVRRISTLREKCPLKSVSDRLAYEAKMSVNGIDADAGSSVRQLNPFVEQRLAANEKRLVEADRQRYFRRRMLLAALHTQTNDEFVEASGFGRRRIADPGAKTYAARLELPDVGSIPVAPEPGPSYDPADDSTISIDVTALADKGLPARDDLLSLLDSGIDDFLDAERFGFVKNRDHVAGFQSHRFTRLPNVLTTKTESPRQWKIARLELVSLLKHETPVAYISRNLPQMDELRDAPTRPLDAFERQSLDSLRSDEDVVIDKTTDRIRMVGSLRAAKTCLDCHSVRRGELLGALTYELVPARPTRKRAAPLNPPAT